ncbi:Ethylene-responsive element binding factor [Arachis hypogaea]|nr:Ethylene-responsive element binding factor [Arachis hypogaea]
MFMSATMDQYTQQFHSDPFQGGELMEVLQPFYRSLSTTTTITTTSTITSLPSSSNSHLPSTSTTLNSSYYNPSINYSSSPQPDFYTQHGCPSMVTPLFPSRLSNSQNFIGFEQPPFSSSIGLNYQIQAQSQTQQSNTLSFLSPKPIPMKQGPPKPTKLLQRRTAKAMGKMGV